jgi:hypothetical protein
MATDRAWDEIDREILDMYMANPGLKDELDELERQIAAGELEGIPDAEVRRQLLELGVPLDDEGA